MVPVWSFRHDNKDYFDVNPRNIVAIFVEPNTNNAYLYRNEQDEIDAVMEIVKDSKGLKYQELPKSDNWMSSKPDAEDNIMFCKYGLVSYTSVKSHIAKVAQLTRMMGAFVGNSERFIMLVNMVADVRDDTNRELCLENQMAVCVSPVLHDFFPWDDMGLPLYGGESPIAFPTSYSEEVTQWNNSKIQNRNAYGKPWWTVLFIASIVNNKTK